MDRHDFTSLTARIILISQCQYTEVSQKIMSIWCIPVGSFCKSASLQVCQSAGKAVMTLAFRSAGDDSDGRSTPMRLRRSDA